MTPIYSEVVNGLLNSFGQRLCSVLLYGSRARQTNSEHSDADIVIVLSREHGKENSDIASLKEVLSPQSNLRPDTQLIYEDELIDTRWLSLDTHGSFIALELQKASILYGNNPFEFLQPSREEIIMSVVRKLQYYVFRLRQLSFGKEFHSKDAPIIDFHRKKIQMAVTDLSYIMPESPEEILDDRSRTQFESEHPLSVSSSLKIMEELYEKAREVAKVYKPLRARRIKMGEMAIDYVAPPHKQNGKAVILCDGFPSVPSHRNLMSRFAELGFLVLLPHYRGTWESEGSFLENSPADDIASLCSSIEKKEFPSSELVSSVILLGTSFGGAVGLCAHSSPLVQKVIALSPVPDFSKLKGESSLFKHLQDSYAHIYRLKEESWGKLIKGLVLNPGQSLKSTSAAVKIIIGGNSDETVPVLALETFSKDNAIALEIVERGHLSFTDAEGVLFAKILKYCLT